MPLVFGFIGCVVFTGGWPILLLLNALGWEQFEWPGAKVLCFLTLNALIGSNLSDILWALALQLTTPLVATLGLSLTIPIGMVSDAVLHGKHFNVRYVAGALIVLVGFMLGSFAERLWHTLRCWFVHGRHTSRVGASEPEIGSMFAERMWHKVRCRFVHGQHTSRIQASEPELGSIVAEQAL